MQRSTFPAPVFHRGMVIIGLVVTVVCSIIGVARPFLGTDQESMDDSGMEMDSSRLHGMPLSDMPEMYIAAVGLLLTIAGVSLRAWSGSRDLRERSSSPPVKRWLTAAVAAAALSIDISKTSTLGFVIPGMRAEYGLDASTSSLLAVSGISGTAIGALLFSRFADELGRRASYLIATLSFTATSMCAMMPGFTGNLVMCFLMGISVGGVAPLLITVLADLFPSGSRGPIVAGLSMVATAVGYLIAAGSALWLEPIFGWRILWLVGAPTGLLLMSVTRLIPERPPPVVANLRQDADQPALRLGHTAFTGGLQRAYAVSVGLAVFGLTTWLPTLSRSSGLSLTVANTLLTGVAAVMLPAAVMLLWCYRRFGPVSVAVNLAFCTAVLLLGLAASGLAANQAWLTAIALATSLFAVNTMAAVFLPVAADLATGQNRARTTGSISFFNRLGGLAGPLLLSLIVSSVSDVLVAIAVLATVCGGIASYTRYAQRAARAAEIP